MRIVISGTILALMAALTLAIPAAADESLPAPIEAPQVDELAVPEASPAPGADQVPEAEQQEQPEVDPVPESGPESGPELEPDPESAPTPGDAEPRPDDLVAELSDRRTDAFSLIGVTWDPGYDASDLLVQVRSRVDGTWTAWEELHVDVEDSEGGRPGTEPWWVGAADGLAVQVTSPSGLRPDGLSVTTIDAGQGEDSAAAAVPAIAVQPVADGSPGYTARPSIISRSSWGARKNTSCDSPRISKESRGVTVHHTAGSNSYSKAQSAAIVRAVQSYHMDGRDWCDIGYNFLVDKYGQIFEGRNGGTDLPVRGAHAGTKLVNLYTMGVAMMGTYTSSEPADATKDAMVQLLGWRIGTTFHPATGSYGIGSDTFQRIAGHRDVVGTACPGTQAYAWLSRDGGLRDRVSAYIADYTSAAKTRTMELGLSRIGPVLVGEYPFSQDGGGRKVRLFRGDVYSSDLGAYYVGSTIRHEYAHFYSQVGGFGVPTSELQPTSNPAVTVQQFNHGSVWQAKRSGKSTSYGIWGPLDQKYRQMGGPTSEVGSPTRRYESLGGGRYRAYFSRGTITREADLTFTITTR